MEVDTKKNENMLKKKVIGKCFKGSRIIRIAWVDSTAFPSQYVMYLEDGTDYLLKTEISLLRMKWN